MRPAVTAKPLLINALTCLQLTECDWRFFYPSEQVSDDKAASSMFGRIGRAEVKLQTDCVGGERCEASVNVPRAALCIGIG